MKRLCLSILVVAMLGGFAFASGGTEAAGTGSLPRVTLSTNVYNVNLDYSKDEVYQAITQKYNVELKLVQVSTADWMEKLQIWIASGDMPDVMNWDFKYHHMPMYNQWVKQGAIRAMPADLSRYPNLKKNVLDKMVTDEALMIDGKRFALPHVRGYAYMPGEGMEYIWEAAHIIYRRDWAKKVGLYKPNDIYTWDEFIALGKAFVEKDPGGNGAGKTIGYTMHEFGFFQGFGGVLYAFPDYPGYGAGYIKKGDKYEWAGTQPGIIEGIKAWRRMVDAKVLWSDMPTAKGAVGLDRYYAGESGALLTYNSQGSIAVHRDKMVQLHNMSVDQVREATAPMHIQRADGSLFALPLDDYWSIAIFSAKMDDQKMDRWLQLQDWMSTTEGLFTYRYGTKGKGWDFAPNGDIKVLWEVDPKTKKYITPSWNVQGWAQFWAVSMDDGYIKAGKTDLNRQLYKVDEDVDAFLAQYKGKLYGYSKPDSYAKFFSGENFNKYGNFANAIHEKVVEIVYGKIPYDKIADEWNAWVKTKMPQVQLVLDELNAGVKK
jgi:putative aldouronate transport system substrate-binding protein